MSPDDMRNTLIVEMTAHSTQTDYRSFNDFDLGGMGAVMVVLRGARIRTDAELKPMSADDQRNVAIVGIAFTFQRAGHVEGTSAGLPFGAPNRNDDFTTIRENPMITREFDGIFVGAKLLASLDGKDKLVGGVAGMLGDLLSQAAEAIGKAAVTAAVAVGV